MIARITAVLLCATALGAEDPRSQVVLGQECGNEFTRREFTLFANGTLRLRQGMGARRTMQLAELGRAEFEAYIRRFEEIRFDDMAASSTGLGGDWVEQCELTLALPDADVLQFDYGRYDSLPHGLRLTLLVVDDLLLEMERYGDEGTAGIRAIELEIGSLVVRRRDGARFEVLGFTMEGTGVELQGIDQPITVILRRDEVQTEFDLAERDSRF